MSVPRNNPILRARSAGVAPKRRPVLPPTVHIELFVVPRARRSELRHRCGDLYRSVRPITQRRGGLGPILFLLEGRPRRRRIPQNLRPVLGAKPDEDLWLELAFYPGTPAMRATLRRLWKSPLIAGLARQVEDLNRKRVRSWTLATGQAAVDR